MTLLKQRKSDHRETVTSTFAPTHTDTKNTHQISPEVKNIYTTCNMFSAHAPSIVQRIASCQKNIYDTSEISSTTLSTLKMHLAESGPRNSCV